MSKIHNPKEIERQIDDIQNRMDALKQKLEEKMIEHPAIVAHFKEREEKLIMEIIEFYEGSTNKGLDWVYKLTGLEKLK